MPSALRSLTVFSVWNILSMPSVPLIIKTTELGVEVHDRGSNDGVPLMGWPETYAAEWCGEWRADFDTMVERM